MFSPFVSTVTYRFTAFRAAVARRGVGVCSTSSRRSRLPGRAAFGLTGYSQNIKAPLGVGREFPYQWSYWF
ncbi:hypothetical protein M404DRAFT_1005420 [Pisolithus tinctorius Marx 270]|uniref:Uncharacterized protein n=1 Tax=Pisolithus tinctorius Marx 270 TaxID=870435 RepID=A0A0C3NSN4_PISTI|nr:hypothetical protein M404DRAFT_1005420 [Pisolithus tinctorius Marx 270]